MNGGASPDLKPPAALYEGAVAAGAKKAKAEAGNIFKLGVVSGCHIAFGAYLAITVGGACPGIAAQNPGLQKVNIRISSTAVEQTNISCVSIFL